MNFEWRPPDSTQPSSSTRSQMPKSTSRNKIPIGTVATRVRTIQGLKTKSSVSTSYPQGSTIKPQRGHRQISTPLVISKQGLTSRCVSSASRSATPGPHQDIDTTHSFLGYRTPRTNHVEEHTSFNATRESGGDARVPMENVSAKDVVYATRSNAYDVGNTSNLEARSSKFDKSPRTNSTTQPTIQNTYFCLENVADSPKERDGEIHNQNRRNNDSSSEPSISGASVATTSTMRRQSVRELFRDHGIQRPAGFASAISNSDEIPTIVTIAQAEVSCHLCSFTNKHVQITCLQCGHPFCAACTAVAKNKCENNCHTQVDAITSDTASRPSQNTDAGKLHHPDKPCLFNVEMLIQQRQFLRTSSQSSKAESGIVGLPRSNVITLETYDQYPSPKKNDQQLSSIKNRATPTSQEGSVYLKEHRTEALSTGSYSEETGKSHEHPATSDKRQAKRSFVAPIRWWRTSSHPYFSTPHSRESQTVIISAETSTPLTVFESSDEADIKSTYGLDPTYVECHGYPRTGHGRRGSPADAGIVGDCQHCIDDCECAACQSTPHAVRCCTNKVHPSIPHVHRASLMRNKRSTRISLSSNGSGGISPLSTTPRMLDLANNSARKFSGKAPNAKEDTGRVPEPVRSNAPQSVLPSKLLPGRISTVSTCADSSDLDLEQRRSQIGPNHRNAMSIKGSTRKRRRRQDGKLRDNCPISTGKLQAQTVEFGKSKSSIRKSNLPLPDELDHSEKPRAKKEIALETLEEQVKRRESRKAKLQQGMKNKSPQAQVMAVEEPGIHSDQTATMQEPNGVNKQSRIARQQIFDATSWSNMSGKLAKEQHKLSGQTPGVRNGESGQIAMKSDVLGIRDERSSNACNNIDIGHKDELPEQGVVSQFQTTSKTADILGITVIVHMSNRDDLVFRVDAALAK